MIIPILPQTQFNYSYLAGATETIVIGDRIPVSGAATVNLSVRIHKISISTGGAFQFLVYGSNPSDTDGTNFLTSTPIGSTSAFATSSPNLLSLLTAISSPVHPFVRVSMQVTGPSAAGAVYAELSADLIVRRACNADSSKREAASRLRASLTRADAASGVLKLRPRSRPSVFVSGTNETPFVTIWTLGTSMLTTVCCANEPTEQTECQDEYATAGISQDPTDP